jgi:hypothetical protein
MQTGSRVRVRGSVARTPWVRVDYGAGLVRAVVETVNPSTQGAQIVGKRLVSVRAVVAGVGVLVVSLATGCGLNQSSSAVTSRPAELVVWGDPDPENDGLYPAVRDVNNVEDRWIVVGTDGRVQFSNGKVCTGCTVEDATISLSGTPRMNIRYSTGPNDDGPRRPFLVSTDGFYIELVTSGEAVTFQEEDVVFEENDDPSDDLAVQADTTPNPAVEEGGGSSSRTGLCGAGLIGVLPLTLLGLVLMPRARRRRV